MNMEITSVNPRRTDGIITRIDVFFTARMNNQSITINGYVEFSKDEFEDLINFPEIENISKQKLVEMIMNGEV